MPVVQPEYGVYPEWVQATGGGLLHRPNDNINLADKLAALLRDAKLRRQLGGQGRQSILENFSSGSMASSTLNVLRRLTAGNNSIESKLPLDAFPSLA